MASMRARHQLAYGKWQADESRSFTAPSDTLFKYRLVWADHKDAGRAAYHAKIEPGDIILSYRGEWLRVLAHTPIHDHDSPFDGLLQVEPA
jgi:hypothetical protein